MNTEHEDPDAYPIALPQLSDEAVVQIRNFIELLLDQFDSHYAPQVRRRHEDRAKHNRVRPTPPARPPTPTRHSETLTPQCPTPPGSNLAAFLYMHVRAISNVEQRFADHRRPVVHQPSPSLIGGISS